jgi:hypothetical protein
MEWKRGQMGISGKDIGKLIRCFEEKLPKLSSNILEKLKKESSMDLEF